MMTLKHPTYFDLKHIHGKEAKEGNQRYKEVERI